MKYIFPIFPGTLRFWIGSLGLAFFIAAIALVWFGIVFQRFRRKLDLSYPEVINATALMSLHQMALSCLICGLLKRLQMPYFLLTNMIMIIGLVLVFSISFREIVNDLREMASGARHALEEIQQDGFAFIVLSAVLLLAIVIVFFVLILPPDSWDAYQYHLPMAALMIQEGHLGPFEVSYDIINLYPKTAEMFFFIPMFFTRSDHWARLVQLFFMLGMIPGVYGLLRHFRLNHSQSFLYSALPIFFINNIYQAYRQWGNIDLILTSVFIMGIVLLAPRRGSPANIFGRIALGLIAALLCYSMKGNGILYLAFYCGMALLLIVHSGKWRTRYWLLPVLLFFVLFPLWSYQNVQNYIYHKNPLYPVRVGFAGKTIFEGKYAPSEMMAVQLPKEIVGKDAYHALLRSWYLLITNSDFLYWGRLGGWGILWLFGIYPLSLLALIYFIVRREWDVLRIRFLLWRYSASCLPTGGFGMLPLSFPLVAFLLEREYAD